MGDIFWRADNRNTPMCGKANGDAYSRTEYDELFSRIGTTYGTGDGSTTFNVPNLMDKFIEGGYSNQIGTTVNAGLPNITGGKLAYPDVGNVESIQQTNSAIRIASPIDRNISFTMGAAENRYRFNDIIATFDASKSNAIYGKSTTVQPPAIKMYPVICAKSNVYVVYCFRRTA